MSRGLCCDDQPIKIIPGEHFLEIVDNSYTRVAFVDKLPCFGIFITNDRDTTRWYCIKIPQQVLAPVPDPNLCNSDFTHGLDGLRERLLYL